MRILVVGSGAREHALAWKLAQEAEVLVTPGNPGIAEDCECLNIGAQDFGGLAAICRTRDIDLVVVGPEDPLIAGLADHLRGAGIAVYGPLADGAQLEGSKAFSKAVMRDAGVPTAQFESFTDPSAAKAFARERFDAGRGVAVKASGNALGKGVIVCGAYEEADAAIEKMMVAKEFGEAGQTVVIEDRLEGPEFSLITLVADDNFVSLPVAQDYKRVFDGDQGPNTGGMGSHTPVEWLDTNFVADVEQRVVAAVLSELRSRGISYRGTLFSGLMMDAGVAHCLEYNVRFGDPETESLMLRIGSGFADALYQAATGAVVVAPEVKANAVVSVVVASGGYPGGYKKGLPITIGPLPAGVKLFHAGTALKDGQLVTNGGRVICVSAEAPTMAEARTLAYEGARAVQFEGAFYRGDIAAGTLNS
jgi:phosphoribosylamine--glycine ligase